ncbi:glycosyltransferase family 2 protein [Psychrobacter glacincola]|uniref:Glycosyltransferase family 2 protein n=1 Tax=Psychrobacter glacincola TaxID=56810 RepID=A0ABW1WCE5_9GAMM|nr:glycosyltransferase family 2 protein [Psychrobacter glacincola]
MNISVYITIGIPFYNAENYLALAIESVISQSFKDWELILVDDGSTDKSLEIAKSFESTDKRIRVISDGLNKKLPYRLNQIIDESDYDYIARMDADDIIHPDRLRIQLEFLEKNPSYDLVSSGIVSIDNSNQVYGYRGVKDIYTDFDAVKRSYPIAHASVLSRRSWNNRNKYNIDYPRSQDYELWSRSASKNDLKIAVLPDLLYYYREEGNLFADKLVKSYHTGFEIYTKYKKSFSTSQFIKLKSKTLIIITMDKLGVLQKIASRRNNKDVSTTVISYHQSIIDKIVTINNY